MEPSPEAIADFAKAEGFSVDMRAMNIADIKDISTKHSGHRGYSGVVRTSASALYGRL